MPESESGVPPPPLSLYVHFPWCLRKCPYCDFNSHQVREGVDETAYVDALVADIERDLEDFGVSGRALVSIFIGGGTPSLLSGPAVSRLLAGIAARLSALPDLEVTLEANPGASDDRRFAAYRAAGVNRLSLGIQSFSDAALRRLGRIHDGADAFAAVRAAREAGFDNLNLDLMFGLPEQTHDGAREDLETALRLEPEHLSYYQLTIEPSTRFHYDRPALPDEDVIWEMQQEGQALLAQEGYAAYEVSAYARSGRQCAHNLNYWRFGDYLGIGAGAHGKITRVRDRTIERVWKKRHPRDYVLGSGSAGRVAGRRLLDPHDRAVEYMMNRLRLVEGFDEEEFEARALVDREWLSGPMERSRARGLIDGSDGRWRATSRGRRFLNDLLGEFL